MSLPRAARALAVALSLPALTACSGVDGSAGDWTVTRDSLASGIPRVVNTPPAAGSRPTWVIEEEQRIGSMEGAGPTVFGQIKGLAVTSDGRVAVLDAQAREVRIFGTGGSHLATWGRQGQGPGELEEPWGLMRSADDRLWVPDHRNDRMSIYHPGTGFETSHPMTILRYGFVWQGVMREDGRILKPSTILGQPGELLRIYDQEMTQVDSIIIREPEGPAVDPTDPPGSFYYEAAAGSMSGYMGVPFYPRGNRVHDPRGQVWASTPGDPSYRITRTTLEGDTTLVIETAAPSVPVPEAARDSAIDRIREQLRERGASTDQDWSKVPGVMPAVAALFVAEDGRLWVRTASADSLFRYDVYEATGEHAGTAVTSLEITPWISPVVRGDQLWAVVTDELDVEYVVRARLTDARDAGEVAGRTG